MYVEKGKTYRITRDSGYFKKKYRTPHPLIIVEGTDKEVFGGSWTSQHDNVTCTQYAVRSTGIPLGGQVYYGKINGLAELVHESELSEYQSHEEVT